MGTQRSFGMSRLFQFIAFFFLFALASVLTGCAKAKSKSKGVVKECVLPADQSGTLSGKWPVTPVPVAVREGDFSGAETSAISAALTSWNGFFGQSKGISVISALSSAASERPSDICSQGLIVGNQFSSAVVIYKHSTGWPYNPDVIALTTVCPRPASSGLKPFNMAVMELNYQHFFRSGARIPDLQSIFLHEFGHLLGLNHSCETKDQAGTPNCNSSSLNPDYFQAIMFPIVFFPNNVNGEQRRELQKNDQGRANCLY
jgi:hypothetical protein